MAHKVEDAVEVVSNFVNNIAIEGELKGFVGMMARQHRTLQQNFTKLCFAWIQHMAALNENQYDLRNEGSVKACRKIMSAVDKYDLALPTI